MVGNPNAHTYKGTWRLQHEDGRITGFTCSFPMCTSNPAFDQKKNAYGAAEFLLRSHFVHYKSHPQPPTHEEIESIIKIKDGKYVITMDNSPGSLRFWKFVTEQNKKTGKDLFKLIAQMPTDFEPPIQRQWENATQPNAYHPITSNMAIKLINALEWHAADSSPSMKTGGGYYVKSSDPMVVFQVAYYLQQQHILPKQDFYQINTALLNAHSNEEIAIHIPPAKMNVFDQRFKGAGANKPRLEKKLLEDIHYYSRQSPTINRP